MERGKGKEEGKEEEAVHVPREQLVGHVGSQAPDKRTENSVDGDDIRGSYRGGHHHGHGDEGPLTPVVRIGIPGGREEAWGEEKGGKYPTLQSILDLKSL